MMKTVQSVLTFSAVARPSDMFRPRFSSKNQFIAAAEEKGEDLGHFVIVERLLMVSLVIMTIAAFLLFAVALWFRHFTEHFLYHLLGDTVEKARDNGQMFYAKFSDRGVNFSVPSIWDRSNEDKNNNHVYLGTWVRVLTDMMLTIVLLLWTASISGFLVIFEKNRVFILAFIMSNLVNLACELCIALFILVGFEPMSDGFRKDLSNTLIEHYSKDAEETFERIANTMMVVGKCCGVNDADDFKHTIITASGEVEHIMHVPYACCRMEKWSYYGNTTPDTVLTCLSEKIHTNIRNADKYYVRGCFSVWAETFGDEFHTPILALAGALASLQIMQLIIGKLLLNWTSSIIRLDKEQLRFSSNSSQAWVSGLRETTMSEMMVAKGQLPPGPDDYSTAIW